MESSGPPSNSPPLKSRILTGSGVLEGGGGVDRLQKCALSHAFNIKFGDSGKHVTRIQIALDMLGFESEEGNGLREAGGRLYGRNTEDMVFQFKVSRRIINTSYQKSPDKIVGIWTILYLDQALLDLEKAAKAQEEKTKSAASAPGPFKSLVAAGPMVASQMRLRI